MTIVTQNTIFLTVECRVKLLWGECIPNSFPRQGRAPSLPFTLLFRCRWLSHALADREPYLPDFPIRIRDYMIAVQDLAVENIHGQRILNQLLNGALQ